MDHVAADRPGSVRRSERRGETDEIEEPLANPCVRSFHGSFTNLFSDPVRWNRYKKLVASLLISRTGTPRCSSQYTSARAHDGRTERGVANLAVRERLRITARTAGRAHLWAPTWIFVSSYTHGRTAVHAFDAAFRWLAAAPRPLLYSESGAGNHAGKIPIRQILLDIGSFTTQNAMVVMI